MKSNKNKISFIDIKYIYIIVYIIPLLFDIGCNPLEKKEKECYYKRPENCQTYLESEVKKRGSVLARDGIIIIKGWTFYLTYFDNIEKKIAEKYVKVDCNCDIIYFDDSKPKEITTPFN